MRITKKLLSLIMVIVMICCAIIIPVSAAARYDKSGPVGGITMTNAVYCYNRVISGNNYIDVYGLTRIDTGSTVSYSPVTLYSQTGYTSLSGGIVYESTATSMYVNPVSTNSAYYTPAHGYYPACTYAQFINGLHQSWVKNFSGNIILGITTNQNTNCT